MAGKNEIKYRLGLEGDEEVKKKLDGVAEHGKNAFKGVNETLGKAGDAGEGHQKSFDKIFEKVKDRFKERGEPEHGEHGGIAHRIKEALHTVHPIAEAADIGGLGRIGAFALAARVGIQGLAVALGGTLLAALEKLADEANSRIARLSSFTGSSHAGKEAEESLGNVADRIRLPASVLAPAQEQLIRANRSQPDAERLDEKGLQDVLATSINFASAGGLDRGKAVDPIAQLFKGIRDNGGLTPDVANAAKDTLPVLITRLLEGLKKQNPNAPGGFYPAPQALRTLQGLGPQAETAAAAAGHENIPDAFSRLGRSTEKVGEALPESHIISYGIGQAADQANEFAENLKKFGASWKRLVDFAKKAFSDPGALQEVERAGHEPFGNTGRNPLLPEAANIESGHGADDHLDKVAEAAGHAAEGLDKVGEAGNKNADERAKEQASDQSNLDRIRRHDATEQAKLDYETKPEENAIKLGRDQIAVETAALQKQQAELALKDADKTKKTSALAPESARQNVDESHVTENQARLGFLQSRGVDTEGSIDEARVQRDQQLEAQRAYERAITASKRAEIEDKYSYLEPQKAELGAKKAQTDIRSADYLERDTKLTKTKDEQGNRLSTDVAGLRYADAQLEEQKHIKDIGQDQLQTLVQILAKIQGGSSSTSGGAQGTQNAGKVEGAGPGVGELKTPEGVRDVTSRVNPASTGGASVRTVEGDRLERERGGGADAHVISSSGGWDANGAGRNLQNMIDLLAVGGLPSVSGKGSAKTLEGGVPLPQPRPPDQQSSLAQPQQLAGLSEALQQVFQSLLSSVTKQPELKQEGPVNGLGIRGEGPAAEPPKELAELGEAAGTVGDKLGALGDAVDSAVSTLNQVQPPSSGGSPTTAATGGQIIRMADGGQARLNASPGGHLSGPGTGTSDSIPADVSNGEFVVNAEETAKNLPLLHSINEGRYSGGAHLAEGGLAGRINAMGLGNVISIPHLAVGSSVPDMLAPELSKSELEGSRSGSDQHFGTVDLRTNHGDFQMMTEKDTLKHLQSAASHAKRYSTGAKPSWYGGGGR